MNKDELLMQINTNLPDNNKQSITAKKLRDSLYGIVEYTDEMDAELATAIEENTPEPEFIEYEDLMAKAERGELEVGKEYRFPYTLITQYETAEDKSGLTYKSAGHYFDIVTRAITPNILSEQVRCMYNENDSYFKDNNAPVAAWQVWINIQRKSEWPVGIVDLEHSKGWIYRFIDNNNIECNYDFKNMMTKMVCVDINEDFESDWKSCVTIAQNDMNETDATFFAYTFSYPGLYSHQTQDWINNIKDASLYQIGEGYQLIDDVKINLWYTDETSGCVFKFVPYFDGENLQEIGNNITNINISNNEPGYYIFDASDGLFNITLKNSTGYIGVSYDINVTGCDNVYLYGCNNINIVDGNNLMLKNCSHCNITDSYNISGFITYYTNVINSTFIEPDEIWYNMILGEDSEAYGLYSVVNCNIYNANYIKQLNNVTDSKFNLEYLNLENINSLYFGGLNNVEFKPGMNITSKTDDIDVFSFNEIANVKFGYDNKFVINDDSDHIFEIYNVTVGDSNEIEISKELPEGDIINGGFSNINSVNIGNGNTQLFIKCCAHTTIGNNNSKIQICSESETNCNNIVIGNNNDIFMTNINRANYDCVITNIIIGNNNEISIGNTGTGKIWNYQKTNIIDIFIGNHNIIDINNFSGGSYLAVVKSLHFNDYNEVYFNLNCDTIENCVFTMAAIDEFIANNNTIISNLNCSNCYIPQITGVAESEWNRQYYIYCYGDFENNLDLNYITNNYLGELNRILHISGGDVYGEPLLGQSFE